MFVDQQGFSFGFLREGSIRLRGLLIWGSVRLEFGVVDLVSKGLGNVEGLRACQGARTQLDPPCCLARSPRKTALGHLRD